MSFVQQRERRPNAGSRMRALLDQEVDMEELFEYNESDDDDEFSTKVIEEEEDKVDSDFDLDSSEGEQEYINEGEALDKQIAKAEKKARRTAYNPPSATTIKKPIERKTKKTSMMDLGFDMERNTRHSSRKNTMLNRMLVEDQIREQNKRKALHHKKDKPIINKLTQEELLAEAAITEERNKHSLLEWQQKEAERKENAKKKDKQFITGSFVRYYSFADGISQDRPKMRKLVLLTSDQEGNTESECITDKAAVDWQINKDINDSDLMGRNLITFVENGTTPKENQIFEKPGETEKDLDHVDLISQLSGWLEKTPKPNKPILCPITGEIAKYRDPSTGVPFSNIQAYLVLKSCLNHELNWSSSSGLYLGNLPSANGVPKGWGSTN
ncbi:YL1 nuclear protein-domain-containing protein [Mucor mucedo]|uniref:YL1 nuclear protein-domain-containing protein n=1 Tax=Mucor mucedo TaxID=29922 RepID=UPI00221E8936|nr:YL1 nuclear protein-domain-containing protein [Mucor mucedo]KAI7873223.1 YL1 nuclear protein-domain-containing protein [Mucor mucedo]